jgi:hypothetical protein
MINNPYFVCENTSSEFTYDPSIPLQNNDFLGTVLYNSEYSQLYIPVVSSDLLYSLYLNISESIPDNDEYTLVYDVYGSNELYLPPPPEGYKYWINPANRLNFLRLFYHNFNSENENYNLIKVSQVLQPDHSLVHTALKSSITYKFASFNSSNALFFNVSDFFTFKKVSEDNNNVEQTSSVSHSFPCEYLTIDSSDHNFKAENYPYANVPQNMPICSNPNYTRGNLGTPILCVYYLFASKKNPPNAFSSCPEYSQSQEYLIDKNIFLENSPTPVRISLSKSVSLDNDKMYLVHNHTENLNIFTIDSSSIDEENLDLESFFSDLISCYESNNIQSHEDQPESFNSYLLQLVRG